MSLHRLVRCGRAVGGALLGQRAKLQQQLRSTSTGNAAGKEHFNEPGGYLFNRPGKKYEPDWALRIYMVFYIGGIVTFLFLYQYKPETSPYVWAKKEALRRIEERGVNLEEYRYKLPKVY